MSRRFDPADDPVRHLAGRLATGLFGVLVVVTLVSGWDALLSGDARVAASAAAGIAFWGWLLTYAARYRRHVLRTGTPRSAALDRQMVLGASIFLGLTVVLVGWATWDRGFTWQYLWSFVLPLYAWQASRASLRRSGDEVTEDATAIRRDV